MMFPVSWIIKCTKQNSLFEVLDIHQVVEYFAVISLSKKFWVSSINDGGTAETVQRVWSEKSI